MSIHCSGSAKFNSVSKVRTRLCALLCAIVVLANCTTNSIAPRAAISVDDQKEARVANMGPVRFFADEDLSALGTTRRDVEAMASARGRPAVLALSGGGSAGAFGAGLLLGWTKRGDRPRFSMVTGVSAGALIAPFAFVGSSADATLARVFRGEAITRLATRNPGLTGLFGSSILKGEPLQNLISTYVSPVFIERVAERHRDGARLLVVTTNLDAERSVVWDMGAIAASSSPDRIELFRKVLLASASIPGIYPPVRIKVDVNGRVVEELHVDGGTTRQIFVFPDAFLVNSTKLASAMRPDLYVVINNELASRFEQVEEATLPIVSRAYSTLIKSSTQATVNATFSLASRQNLNAKLAFIDEVVPYKASDPFAKDYMNAVFALGFDKGLNAAWRNKPPIGEVTLASTK